MKKIERKVVEVDYVCEVCGRKSGSDSVIERCEDLHKVHPHEWWADTLNSLYFYETAEALLRAANNKVYIEMFESVGVTCYDIYVDDSISVFYLDSYDTIEEALSLCQELGWKVVDVE